MGSYTLASAISALISSGVMSEMPFSSAILLALCGMGFGGLRSKLTCYLRKMYHREKLD